MNEHRFRKDQPEYRLPVVILKDNSESTKFIKYALDEQMRRIIHALKKSAGAEYSIELTAVHYSTRDRYEILYRGDADDVSNNILDVRAPNGVADSGTALLRTLRELKQRKEQMTAENIRCWTPVVLLLTDGPSTAGRNASAEEKKRAEENFLQACEELTTMQREGMIRFVVVGIEQIRGPQPQKEQYGKLVTDPADLFLIGELPFDGGFLLDPVIDWLNRAVGESARVGRQSIPIDASARTESSNGQEKSRGGKTRTRVHDTGKETVQSREEQIDDTVRGFFHLRNEAHHA